MPTSASVCPTCKASFTGGEQFCPCDGTPLRAELPDDPLAGRVLSGRYRLIEVIGRGGMGAVYRARDKRLGRQVALKFILGGDAGTTQRFLQEARSQSRLDHPCICRVYEVGFVDQKPYIALELIEGSTLDRANLSLTEKLQIFSEAAEAVDYAHQQGVIHRDIKPSELTTEREASNIVPN